MMSTFQTRILDGFDDPAFGQDQWEALLQKNKTDIIYMTCHWQRAWWETYQHRGQLLLIAAERDGEIVAVAPFYTHAGMVYFVSSEFESDYLDFIGDISEPEVLDALLQTARDCVQNFQGFAFYFVPDRSGTAEWLKQAAARLGLSCYEKYSDPAPVLDLAEQPDIARAAVTNKRLRYHERLLHRDEPIEVHRMQDGEAILCNLTEFFQQHIARWEGTANPSRFVDPKTRLLIERFTRAAAHTGWLRFTRVDWKGRPIAFHYGYCYRGRYFWGIASFAPGVARYSPGQVLLRQLLLAAIEEGARTFDFGTGNAAFKLRFATHINYVRRWNLYPSRRLVHSQVVPE
jgi:CelD/BcsL family acetyltransferase involved in cellulose biosynthesis